MKIVFRIWGRMAQWLTISIKHYTSRWSVRNEDFLGVKDDEANEQHKNTIEALKAAALKWTFEQINFVAGRRGAVVEDDYHYNKLGRLNVQARKRDKILAAHVQRMCEAQDTVICLIDVAFIN